MCAISSSLSKIYVSWFKNHGFLFSKKKKKFKILMNLDPTLKGKY